MADSTTLPQCFVFINKGTALLRVTLETRFVFAQERKTPGSERLLNVCRGAFNCDSFVRLMTIAAAHFAFEHRVVMRQCERGANL
jgi:hypothetical protein